MDNDLYKNKYRIPSTRLPGWDYSWPGIYFVTICTQDREFFFGRVIDNKMVLNNIGQIVNYYWSQIPKYFDNISLDEHITMPNHIHGTIIVNHNNSKDLFEGINYFLEYGFNPCAPPVETPHQDITTIHENSFNDNNPNIHESSRWGVSTVPSTTKTPHQQKTQMNNFSNNQDLTHSFDNSRWGVSTLNPHHNPQWKPNSLGVIVNQFKTTCTKRIWRVNPHFNWQSRFYDRIIRNEAGLHNARYYIISNPERWYRDRNNPAGLGM